MVTAKRAKKATKTKLTKNLQEVKRLDELIAKYSQLGKLNTSRKFAATYFEGVVAGLGVARKLANGVDDDDVNPLDT